MGNISNTFLNTIKLIVNNIIQESGLLENEWHYGTIERINGNGTANVRIDGSNIATTYVPYNPDINIKETDKVIILYINRNKQNAYIMCKKS